MKYPSEEWLAAVNHALRESSVPPHRRPMLALQQWAEEHDVSLGLGSPVARCIFAWFADETGGRAARGEPFYLAAHYFDAGFWKLEIPLVYGEVGLNPLQFVRMPNHLVKEIAADGQALNEYLASFTDWCDYALSLDDLRKPRLEGLAGDLIASAARDVESMSLGLLSGSMNQNVAVLARSATEKHLKFSLAYGSEADESELRRLGHNLEALIQRVESQVPELRQASLGLQPSRFPAHGDRYRELDLADGELWYLYKVARRVGVACVRLATNRHSTASVSAP